jgi:integrase
MSASYTMLLRAEAYLAERRRLGLALNRPGSQIIGFRAFCGRGRSQGALDVRHCSPMGEGRSAGRTPLHMGQKGRRSSPVRTLSHRSRSTHRVSNRCSFRSFKTPARTAYLYTTEVDALIGAASRLSPQGGLTPATFATLFGLLAATGLRISEALNLRCGDIDGTQAHLTVRHSKFQQTRLVPLHSTTTEALRRYLRTRQIWFNGYHHAALHVREDRGGASV